MTETVIDRKMAVLRDLQTGWHGAGTLPMDLAAAGNFMAFTALIPNDRHADAEPCLTDDGRIRIEWDAHGHSYIAEIGGESLFLCALAPVDKDDWDAEIDHFDLDRLLAFFLRGELS